MEIIGVDIMLKKSRALPTIALQSIKMKNVERMAQKHSKSTFLGTFYKGKLRHRGNDDVEAVHSFLD